MSKKTKAAIKSAIENAGGPVKLADKLGISSQAISQWSECPPRKVLQVEAVSGVSRYELRPDLYGPQP